MNKQKMYRIIPKVLLHAIRTLPYSCAIIFFAYLISAAVPSLISLIIARMFDNVEAVLTGYDVFGKLIMFGVFYCLIYLLIDQIMHLAHVAQNKRLYEYFNTLNHVALGEKSSRMPMISFEQVDLEDMRNRANKCIEESHISELFMIFVQASSRLISMIGIIVVLSTYSLWFIPISLISVSPFLIVRIMRGKELYELTYAQTTKRRYANYLWKLFGSQASVKEMRTMQFVDYLDQKWTDAHVDLTQEMWQYDLKLEKSLALSDGLRTLGYIASLAVTLWYTLTGGISVGVFGACVAAFKMAQEQMMMFLEHLGSLPKLLLLANDYYSYMDLPEEENGEGDMESFCDIRIQNCSFQYPGSDKYSLKNVSLTIEKGKRVVILGENGSGKTTLVKVLLGQYKPCEGNVKINGRPLEEIDKTKMYRLLSVVPQNFTQYHLTLRENLTLGNPRQLDEQKMNTILEQVGLPELTNLPEGLNQELGLEFGGMELSGGQWQRLAIARCLCSDGEVVVLDEPTSALDPIMETEVLKHFLKISQGKTSLIVSHRVGLCRFSDLIVLMKQGEIIGTGTHEELIKNNEEYIHLYQSQQKWYTD